MPLYLSRFTYTPETWARLIDNPEDRRTAAQSYIESVGGKLHGFWYAFGSHDGYNLWEAPDNVSMAAVALAIGGGGALSSFETTVLMSVDETLDALRKAQDVQYRAPAAAPDPRRPAPPPGLVCASVRDVVRADRGWSRTPDATGPSRVAPMPAESNAPGALGRAGRSRGC